MPNFEELKRNASGVADRAVKKTNELTAFVKLKMGIKASEAKLSSVCSTPPRETAKTAPATSPPIS